MPDLVASAKSPLIDLSAAEAVTAIRRGDLSAERYARALLDRCTQLRDLNAFIALDYDAVLEAAQKLAHAEHHAARVVAENQDGGRAAIGRPQSPETSRVHCHRAAIQTPP